MKGFRRGETVPGGKQRINTSQWWGRWTGPGQWNMVWLSSVRITIVLAEVYILIETRLVYDLGMNGYLDNFGLFDCLTSKTTDIAFDPAVVLLRKHNFICFLKKNVEGVFWRLLSVPKNKPKTVLCNLKCVIPMCLYTQPSFQPLHA